MAGVSGAGCTYESSEDAHVVAEGEGEDGGEAEEEDDLEALLLDGLVQRLEFGVLVAWWRWWVVVGDGGGQCVGWGKRPKRKCKHPLHIHVRSIDQSLPSSLYVYIYNQ